MKESPKFNSLDVFFVVPIPINCIWVGSETVPKDDSCRTSLEKEVAIDSASRRVRDVMVATELHLNSHKDTDKRSSNISNLVVHKVYLASSCVGTILWSPSSIVISLR